MAASWRNFTLSILDAPFLRNFRATWMFSTPFFHKPCSTEPNCPDPRWPFTLGMKSTKTIHFLCVTTQNEIKIASLLNKTGWDISDSTCLQLGIKFILSSCWLKILFHVTINILFFVLSLEHLVMHMAINCQISAWDSLSPVVLHMMSWFHPLENGSVPSWHPRKDHNHHSSSFISY